MTKLIGTGANQVPTNADLGKLAYQDAIANGTGTAGQVLQSGGATGSPAWATVSSDPAAVVFPSDWASPTNTYNSSGTWSKGSLSDDAYVWFFLISSGGGGAEVHSASGGTVRLIYAKAGLLNGATFVIGAAVAGTSQNVGSIAKNHTTLTLSSGNGGTIYSTPDSDTNNILNVVTAPTIKNSGTYFNSGTAEAYNFSINALPSGYTRMFTTTYGANGVFGGGQGQAPQIGGNANTTSLLSGNGGTTASVNGSFPGGGGAAGQNAGGTGGTGAAGNVRVYHV